MNTTAKKKPGAKRTAPKETRKQQLIDATIDSISKHGFSGTTLQSVTKGANLSHGVVNFHFTSKEALYDETLGYLALEHYALWHSSMQKAGPDPANQLAAIVEADFHIKICSTKKLAVWFAFWGRAKYRPNYLKIHYHWDEERFTEIIRLCGALSALPGNSHLSAERIARSLEALIDGIWLNLLMYPSAANRQQGRDDCFAYLATVFPNQFQHPSKPASQE